MGETFFNILSTVGVECQDTWIFWKFMIVYFIIGEILIWLTAYCIAQIMKRKSELKGVIVFVLVIVFCVIDWKVIGMLDGAVNEIKIAYNGKLILIILTIMQMLWNAFSIY